VATTGEKGLTLRTPSAAAAATAAAADKLGSRAVRLEPCTPLLRVRGRHGQRSTLLLLE
jgi:hypothetical protein